MTDTHATIKQLQSSHTHTHTISIPIFHVKNALACCPPDS